MSGVLRRPVAADRSARPAPLHIDTGGPWQDRAACNGLDPDAWFAEGAYKGSYEDARDTCMTLCPVRAECLEMALADPLLSFGMYGGLDPDERQVLRRGEGRRSRVQTPKPARPPRPRRPKLVEDDHARRRALHAQGLNDRQIGEREGVPRTRIQEWRTAQGLPANLFKRDAS